MSHFRRAANVRYWRISDRPFARAVRSAQQSFLSDSVDRGNHTEAASLVRCRLTCGVSAAGLAAS